MSVNKPSIRGTSAPPLRPGLLALLLAAAVLLYPSFAVAGPCTCRESPVEQVVYAADVIFVGTVTRMQAGPSPEQARVEFTVFEVAKGPVPQTIALHTTPASDPDCLGFDFVEGSSYLVFASTQHSRSHEPGTYGVNTCAGTRLVSASGGREFEAIARVVREQAVAVERPAVGVYPPEVLKEVPPVWPADAQLQSGTVTVNLIVTVNASGRAGRVRVTRAVAGFEQAAIDCVKQWEYRTALANGVPVPASLTVSVTFTR